MEKVYRISEASKVLAMSRATLYKLLAEKRVHAVRIGKSWRIPESALRRFLELGGDGGPDDDFPRAA